MHLPTLVSAIALLPAVSEASPRGDRAEKLPVRRVLPDEHASRARYSQRQPFRDAAVKAAADNSSSAASSSAASSAGASSSAPSSEASSGPRAASASSLAASSASASSSLLSNADASSSASPSSAHSSGPLSSGRPHFFPLTNGTSNGTYAVANLNGTGTGFSSSLPASSDFFSASSGPASASSVFPSASSDSLSALGGFQSALAGFQSGLRGVPAASSGALPSTGGPSCTFSVVTLTETIDITVSVTASWFDPAGRRPWFDHSGAAPVTAAPLASWSHGKDPGNNGSSVNATYESDPASWSSQISQSGYSAGSAAPLTASDPALWSSHIRHHGYNASKVFPLTASPLGSWSNGKLPVSSGSSVDAIYASSPASLSFNASRPRFNSSGESPITALPLGSFSQGKGPGRNGSSVEAIAAPVPASEPASIEQSSFSAISASSTSTSDPALLSWHIHHHRYNASRVFPFTASPLDSWSHGKRPGGSGSIVDAIAASATPSLSFNASRPLFNASSVSPLQKTASYPMGNSSALPSFATGSPSNSEPCDDEMPSFTTPPVYPTPSAPSSKLILSNSLPTGEALLPFDSHVTNGIYRANDPTASYASGPAAAQSALPVSSGLRRPEDPYRSAASTLIVSIKRVTSPFPRLATPPTSTSTATHTWWTTLVIDPAIAPVTTATLAASFASTVALSKTVCATNAPSGTPAPDSAHCGVHGKPVGDYFIGEFVQNKEGVPVTLEGCFQFCTSVWGSTHGCQSYDYYLNSLGAPRCMLYGSPVAYAVDEIDNHQPNTWFDMDCGNPMSAKWATVRSSSKLDGKPSFGHVTGGDIWRE